MPLDASFRRCVRHIPLGGGPGHGQEHAGGTKSLDWPMNALGSPQKSCPPRLVPRKANRTRRSSIFVILTFFFVFDYVSSYAFMRCFIVVFDVSSVSVIPVPLFFL
ncbi:hypothetical protein XENOCAPTIV_029156 [Xenoophorus captivus]|uniref:Uncharacterized protein n=1 Tax=Xenoophorus captivus TaxID=1517983 RepID=A0ABV0RE55_9TELE